MKQKTEHGVANDKFYYRSQFDCGKQTAYWLSNGIVKLFSSVAKKFARLI